MATNKTSNPATTPLGLRPRSEMTAFSTAALVGQARNEEQVGIIRQTDTDFARQRAYMAKEQHAQHVLTRSAESAAHHFVNFTRNTATLRAQVASDPNQHIVEQFLARLEEDHANSLLATHYIAEQKVQDIVAAPVDPPAVYEEEIIVEVPNLITKIFGGHTSAKRIRK